VAGDDCEAGGFVGGEPATGGWQCEVFVADLYVITSPSRVRITIAGDRATAAWNLVPLVGASLLWQLSPDLITRPNRS
jgi:hypothetical protein